MRKYRAQGSLVYICMIVFVSMHIYVHTSLKLFLSPIEIFFVKSFIYKDQHWSLTNTPAYMYMSSSVGHTAQGTMHV